MPLHEAGLAATFPRGILPAMTVTYNSLRGGEAPGLEGPLGQSSATDKQEGFPNYIFFPWINKQNLNPPSFKKPQGI